MRMTTTCEAQSLNGNCPARQVGIARRRLLFFSLVGATMLVLVAGLAIILSQEGLTVLELAMLALFALNLPWIASSLWNSAIGFVLLRVSPDSLRKLVPLAGLDQPPPPPARRIAIVMPVHDEDPASVFRSLRATVASLDATGRSRAFDIFLLSDTQDERLASAERTLFAAWKRSDCLPGRLHYRRRIEKSGFKAGNLRDFCNRWGRAYDFMVVLDADSTMSGDAILRLVGLMQANPKLGILQTLVVGLPSMSAFTRIFQFGMRHGMRTYSVGSAWWQGDAGPYWGHNAIIRLAPFIEHCRLPRIPGRPPLGGEVLSHDQIEAMLMRRAGWEVRVVPFEGRSFEANPPTLPDFIKRDLRWGHGNMQYWRLLALARGAHWLSRVQILLAISMYTWAPCWIGFCALGLVRFIYPVLGSTSGRLWPEPAGLHTQDLPALSLSLLIFVVASTWAPKLFGALQALSDPAERRKYGGAIKLLGGAGVELFFSVLLAPVMIVARTIFLAGLLFGRRRGWASQRRRNRRVSRGDAARELWPQTLLGIIAALLMLILAPRVLLWAVPVLAGLLLAIPFAVATTNPGLGRLFVRARLCAVPEELSPPPEVRAVCGWLSAVSAHSDPPERLTDRMVVDAVS
jgi:membrane glycosyltransferase